MDPVRLHFNSQGRVLGIHRGERAQQRSQGIAIHGQPDFLAVGRASSLALVERHHFVAAIGIGVAADDAQVAGLELAHHLDANADLELATMQSCRRLAPTLAGDEPPPLFRHPRDVLLAQRCSSAGLRVACRQFDPLAAPIALFEHQRQAPLEARVLAGRDELQAGQDMQQLGPPVLEELGHEAALVPAAVLGMKAREFAQIGSRGDVPLDSEQLLGRRRVGLEHGLQRRESTNDLVRLGLVVDDVLLQGLLGSMPHQAHLLAKNLAQIVDDLGASATDHGQRQGVALGRRQVRHAGRVQAVPLQRPLRHLDDGDGSEHEAEPGPIGQVVVARQQLAHAVDRRPGSVLLDVVPGADPAGVVADDKQRVDECATHLVQRAMDLRKEILVGGRTARACLAHQGVEGRQLVAVAHQDLDADVDDVGDILAGQRRVVERLFQQRLACCVQRLDVEKFAHCGQVFAPRLGGVVALQGSPVGAFAGRGGDALNDGRRHVARGHEIAQALKRLEQQHEAQTGSR